MILLLSRRHVRLHDDLSYASGALYTLANVFMLAWDYGTPRVLSDYAYSSYDQGPPSAGGNAIAFSRGSSAWVAIDTESSPVTETFATGLPAGTYCDVITGGLSGGTCTGTAVAVNAAGQATRVQSARAWQSDAADAVDVDRLLGVIRFVQNPQVGQP